MRSLEGVPEVIWYETFQTKIVPTYNVLTGPTFMLKRVPRASLCHPGPSWFVHGAVRLQPASGSAGNEVGPTERPVMLPAQLSTMRGELPWSSRTTRSALSMISRCKFI